MSTQTSVDTPIRQIHLIFKTHLDVGFTDFAGRVVQNYFERYIPKAIQLARQTRENAAVPAERFIWTTGSWLIYEYLERADAAARKEMEAAIANGDIVWHALPFTTHSENMDPTLFRFGLSLSQELDQRFGKHTIAAKMTDVPGHTRGIVPLLAEAGVQFLHIGVNAASTPPDVPPVFVWRDPPSGAELIVMYHKGSYGELMIVPGLADAIAFAHTNDNLGPQSPEQLHQIYHHIREQFPGAAVNASTMVAFAAQLTLLRDSLPVIRQEIGDTWIHGAGTDPGKESRYRELLRWRSEQLAAGTPAEDLRGFQHKLILIPEHTWGLDVKTHLGDWNHYQANDFLAARSQPNYQKMEASWQEQRAYIRQAVDALPPHLKENAEERLAALQSEAEPMDSFDPLRDLTHPLVLQQFEVSFDPEGGAITGLILDGIQWAGPQNPLGRFWFETFSAADYARFHRQYNVNKRSTREWAIPDFTKPGLEASGAQRHTYYPKVTWAGKRSNTGGDHLAFLLDMPQESCSEYGAPLRIRLDLQFSASSPEINFDLRWFHKTASRLPQATWFSFNPKVRDPRRWRMEKLGEWVSPYEVIRDGNRHLHAVGQGVRAEGPTHVVEINTLDAVLLAPGEPSLLNFTNRQPNLNQGLHFNLYNNLWGTNFPMWYDEDARFRFTLRLRPLDT